MNKMSIETCDLVFFKEQKNLTDKQIKNCLLYLSKIYPDCFICKSLDVFELKIIGSLHCLMFYFNKCLLEIKNIDWHFNKNEVVINFDFNTNNITYYFSGYKSLLSNDFIEKLGNIEWSDLNKFESFLLKLIRDYVKKNIIKNLTEIGIHSIINQ